MKPVIGITMGDAAGIGPELILKAAERPQLHEACRPLVIGSRAVMDCYRKLLRLDTRFNVVTQAGDALYQNDSLDILDTGLLDELEIKPGVINSTCGKAAVIYTQEAGRLAMAGKIDAIVSAPLNKESMRKAGYMFEGQTQILAELTGADKYGMILLLGHIRIMMLTTHVSLRQACDAATKSRVLSMIELSDSSLRSLGIEHPRIAVAGLNPHSGEGGLFGTEEVQEVIPAIRAAAGQGIDVQGPVPADVVFVKAKDGEFDLVLAMFHDQANMAAKLLGFGEVVTLLAGLPIIRTSVGHGTAFDIAGQGIAREQNLVSAIEAAVDFTKMKNRKQT